MAIIAGNRRAKRDIADAADTPKPSSKASKRPFTGAEYLESLRDGREVYIYGERVKDVTTHPAFRNAAVSVAKLYDALHDAKTQGGAHHRRPTPAPAATRTASSRPPARART